MNLLAIGTSAGGVTAIQSLLSHLPPQFKTPIAIVQHIPEQARVRVDLIFSHVTNLKIVEVEDKMPIEKGHVYLAPPGYHLLVERSKTFALSLDEPVQFSRPSIDIFFESVARAFGDKVIGVLLTGANSDGALGLLQIHRQGGKTLVQDPLTAESSTMPAAAIGLFKPDFVLPIPELAKTLTDLEGVVYEAN